LSAALLRAVEEILRKSGPHGLSLRAAARMARVSHSAPAHHYRNKAGLLTAFAVDGFERLSRTVADAVLRYSPKSGADLLEVLGAAYVQFAFSNPHHFAMMYRTDLLNLKDPEFQRANHRSFGILWQAVGRCVDEGLIPRRNVDEATVALWSLAYGLVMLKFSGRLAQNLPSAGDAGFSERAIRFFVRGLLVPAAAGRRGGKAPG
jgi:AcrR family transcriptional regulator